MSNIFIFIVLILIIVNQIIHSFMLRDVQDDFSHLSNYYYRVSEILSQFNKSLKSIKVKVNVNDER